MGYENNNGSRGGKRVMRSRSRMNGGGWLLPAILICLVLAGAAGAMALRTYPGRAEEGTAVPESAESAEAAENTGEGRGEGAADGELFAEPEPEAVLLTEEVQSEYAILLDADTGTVIAEKNMDERMYPASMTKVLTLLVAAEHLPHSGGTFTMTRAIADYCFVNECSVVGYEVGEKIPLSELFYGCIMCSGADACLALAELSAGSHEAFVEWMNEKLGELGLSGTMHCTNCVGVFDEEHYSTARDMALVMKAALEDEFCREVLSRHILTSEPTEEHPDGQVLSNWFLRRIEDQDTGTVTVACGKTGYVPESGSCAVSYGENESGGRYICVTGKSASSWQTIYDHAALYQELCSDHMAVQPDESGAAIEQG